MLSTFEILFNWIEMRTIRFRNGRSMWSINPKITQFVHGHRSKCWRSDSIASALVRKAMQDLVRVLGLDIGMIWDSGHANKLWNFVRLAHEFLIQGRAQGKCSADAWWVVTSFVAYSLCSQNMQFNRYDLILHFRAGISDSGTTLFVASTLNVTWLSWIGVPCVLVIGQIRSRTVKVRFRTWTTGSCWKAGRDRDVNIIL